MKTDLAKLTDALTKHVRIGSFPVAVRMVKPGEQLPERVKHPAQDLKIKVATCQAIAMARRYGWVVAVGDEDISCPVTAVVFGFRKASDFYMKGQACAGMYTETNEAGIRSGEQVAKFSFGEFKYILVGPLHRTTFEPEVIIIYAKPAQILRLLAAALW